MKNLPIFLEYSDGEHFIQLLKEKDKDQQGTPLAADCVFTLYHNLADERPLKGLSYVEATILWVGLLAELVEIHTELGGKYPYTKEQFVALLNCYTQADSPILSEVLAETLSKETLNLGL